MHELQLCTLPNMPVADKTRKVRNKPAPYTRKPREKAAKDAPKTSAKRKESGRREHLTLADWLTVFAFIDTHPLLSQGEVVKYFANRADGVLIFSQSALSRKLDQRQELENRASSHPSALSSKRPRVVTRPDVERALILWVHHMESLGETVSGPMLRAKRGRIEDLLDVPAEDRLPGEGWVPSFCKAYKLKEFRRHGEAGSVDLEAVDAERKRMQGVLKRFAPRDISIFDETGLCPK